MKPTTIPPAAPRRSSRRTRRSSNWLVRGRAVALLTVCLIGLTAGSAVAAPRAHVQATQELVALLTAHSAHQAPQPGSPQVSLVPARRPITGEQTTLPVLARSIGAGGVRWLRVMLPGRPNGSTGWIAQLGTRALVTPWYIVVNLGARRIKVYDNGRMVRSFQVVVGKPSTPTPTGQFFVEESVKMAPSEAGGPFALALSARSDALQEFEGGPGQIAIHGRDNLGGVLGTAASHGCIRVGTANIDWMSARVDPGTPVTIEGG
jgi:lipoprotein-anchoring transpeptidase ErfK/SrfK